MPPLLTNWYFGLLGTADQDRGLVALPADERRPQHSLSERQRRRTGAVQRLLCHLPDPPICVGEEAPLRSHLSHVRHHQIFFFPSGAHLAELGLTAVLFVSTHTRSVCLRSWLERNHSCPTCRQPLGTPPAATAAARDHQPGVGSGSEYLMGQFHHGDEEHDNGAAAPHHPTIPHTAPQAQATQFQLNTAAGGLFDWLPGFRVQVVRRPRVPLMATAPEEWVRQSALCHATNDTATHSVRVCRMSPAGASGAGDLSSRPVGVDRRRPTTHALRRCHDRQRPPQPRSSLPADAPGITTAAFRIPGLCRVEPTNHHYHYHPFITTIATIALTVTAVASGRRKQRGGPNR